MGLDIKDAIIVEEPESPLVVNNESLAVIEEPAEPKTMQSQCNSSISVVEMSDICNIQLTQLQSRMT